jgi:hypothetical protein
MDVIADFGDIGVLLADGIGQLAGEDLRIGENEVPAKGAADGAALALDDLLDVLSLREGLLRDLNSLKMGSSLNIIPHRLPEVRLS